MSNRTESGQPHSTNPNHGFSKKLFNIFISISIIFTIIISVLALFSIKSNLIQNVYAGFTDSKNKIMDFSSTMDSKDVITRLDTIETNLKKSQQTLVNSGQSGSYFRHFGLVGSDIGTTQRISRIAQNTRELSQNIKPFLKEDASIDSFNVFDIRERIKTSIKLVYEINQDLSILEQSQFIDKKLFDELQIDLIGLEKYLNNFKKIYGFMPEIMGFYENQKYLLLFQNNRAARSTGGFIGSFGILGIDNGKFDKPYVQDSYYFNFLEKTIYKNDNEYKAKSDNSKKNYPEELMPPNYVKDEVFNGRWIWDLLDRNWMPDFPTAAKSVQYAYNQIYQQENVDGIIAIDTNLVVDILKIIGEIKVPTENVVLNSENFADTVEYKVEIDNDLYKGNKNANRKQILVDFMSILVEELNNLKFKDYYQISKVFLKNLDSKNVQIYFNNPRLQNTMKDIGFSGELKDYKQDYLYINRTNIANIRGSKASQRIKNHINYSVNIKENGEAESALRISRKHLGSRTQFDGKLKTYLQILTPQHSKLLNSEINQTNNSSSTKSYNYFNRNIFTETVFIDENESQILDFRYKLPFKIKENLSGKGNYELLIQKQPGFNDFYEVNIQFPLNWVIDSNSQYQIENNIVTWKGKLIKDKNIVIKFRK
ncbi:DUF4012 domain-containing protein [Patescibacteria group bacterium]